MILEVAEGPGVGRRIAPREGAVVTVGRTSKAMEVFAEDDGMSGLHFAAALRGGALYLTNLSQSNGTHLNGQPVPSSAALKDGDRVTAGGTVFRVIGPPPNPYPAQFRVGGWGFNAIPEGWRILEGAGLIWDTSAGFQPNAAALEDGLPEARTLADYVGAQIAAAQAHLTNAKFEGPAPASIEGADEALRLTVRSVATSGEVVLQQQLYALSGGTVGALTLSVGAGDAAAFQAAFGEILRGVSFHKPRVLL